MSQRQGDDGGDEKRIQVIKTHAGPTRQIAVSSAVSTRAAPSLSSSSPPPLTAAAVAETRTATATTSTSRIQSTGSHRSVEQARQLEQLQPTSSTRLLLQSRLQTSYIGQPGAGQSGGAHSNGSLDSSCQASAGAELEPSPSLTLSRLDEQLRLVHHCEPLAERDTSLGGGRLVSLVRNTSSSSSSSFALEASNSWASSAKGSQQRQASGEAAAPARSGQLIAEAERREDRLRQLLRREFAAESTSSELAGAEQRQQQQRLARAAQATKGQQRQPGSQTIFSEAGWLLVGADDKSEPRPSTGQRADSPPATSGARQQPRQRAAQSASASANEAQPLVANSRRSSSNSSDYSACYSAAALGAERPQGAQRLLVAPLNQQPQQQQQQQPKRRQLGASAPKVARPAMAPPVSDARLLPAYFLAELVGTFLLVCIGDGAIAAFVFQRRAVDIFCVCLSFGVGAMIATYASARVSGAHINPAASLAFALDGRLKWRLVPVYMLAQYLGGFLAALLLMLNYSEAIEALDGGQRSAFGERNSTGQVFATYPADYVSLWGALLDQVLGTALLLFALSAVSDQDNLGPEQRQQPLVVAFVVGVVCVAFSPNCGAIFNPARDLAPRLLTFLFGYKSAWSPLSGSYWFLAGVLGPHVGAILGLFAYKCTIGYALELHKCHQRDHEQHEQQQQQQQQQQLRRQDQAQLQQHSPECHLHDCYQLTDGKQLNEPMSALVGSALKQ